MYLCTAPRSCSSCRFCRFKNRAFCSDSIPSIDISENRVDNVDKSLQMSWYALCKSKCDARTSSRTNRSRSFRRRTSASCRFKSATAASASTFSRASTRTSLAVMVKSPVPGALVGDPGALEGERRGVHCGSRETRGPARDGGGNRAETPAHTPVGTRMNTVNARSLPLVLGRLVRTQTTLRAFACKRSRSMTSPHPKPAERVWGGEGGNASFKGRL